MRVLTTLLFSRSGGVSGRRSGTDTRKKIAIPDKGDAGLTLSGGTVTDVDGKPLDFSLGRTLANNRGVIATAGVSHEKVVAAVGDALA